MDESTKERKLWSPKDLMEKLLYCQTTNERRVEAILGQVGLATRQNEHQVAKTLSSRGGDTGLYGLKVGRC